MQSDIKDKRPTTDEVDVHRTIVLWLFLATTVFTIFLASSLIYADKSGEAVLSTLPVVILAGVLGSFVSALNRIYSFSNIFPLGKYTVQLKKSNGYLIAYSSIPPLVGGISAAVLYVIFSGQIITGPFFPNFTCDLKAGCNEFHSFLEHWSPDQAQDYAKAIVWGFIAGFSERFVPDILNQVTKESQ